MRSFRLLEGGFIDGRRGPHGAVSGFPNPVAVERIEGAA